MLEIEMLNFRMQALVKLRDQGVIRDFHLVLSRDSEVFVKHHAVVQTITIDLGFKEK